MASPAIRAAVAGDADELTRLARRAKASWDYPASWQREWEPVLSFSTEYIAREEVFVAEAQGKLVGVVAMQEAASGPEIDHLWISPESQGRGIGRALLGRAIEVAERRGWKELRIESDPNAQAFYEHMGAIKVGDVDAPVAGVARTLPVLRLSI